MNRKNIQNLTNLGILNIDYYSTLFYVTPFLYYIRTFEKLKTIQTIHLILIEYKVDELKMYFQRKNYIVI